MHLWHTHTNTHTVRQNSKHIVHRLENIFLCRRTSTNDFSIVHVCIVVMTSSSPKLKRSHTKCMCTRKKTREKGSKWNRCAGPDFWPCVYSKIRNHRRRPMSTHIFCISLCFTCHWRMWSCAGPFYDDIVLMTSSSTIDRHKMKIQRELFSFLIYKFIHDRRLNALRRCARSWRAHESYCTKFVCLYTSYRYFELGYACTSYPFCLTLSRCIWRKSKTFSSAFNEWVVADCRPLYVSAVNASICVIWYCTHRRLGWLGTECVLLIILLCKRSPRIDVLE